MYLLSLKTSDQLNSGFDTFTCQTAKVTLEKNTKLMLAKAAYSACAIVNTIAIATLIYNISQNTSFLNPWSERNSQFSWFSQDHLPCFVIGTSGIALSMLGHIISKVQTPQTPAKVDSKSVTKHNKCSSIGQTETLFLVENATQNDVYKESAKKLAEEIKNVFALDRKYSLGYYRNSDPVFRNMMIALEAYAKKVDLSQKIPVISSLGMGGIIQPDTVEETFLAALDPSRHGGMQETILAIKEALEKNELQDERDELLLKIGEQILVLLPKLVLESENLNQVHQISSSKSSKM